MALRNSLMACATALALVPALAVTAAAPVFAKGGEGGGNGGGNGGGSDYSPGQSGDRGMSASNGNGRGAGARSGGGETREAKADSRAGRAAARADERTARSDAKEERTAAKADRPKIETHGSIASSLKGLNAAHASLNAYVNAAPGSRVGRIADYRAALLAAEAAELDPEFLAAQEAYLAALGAFDEGLTEQERLDALEALSELDDEGGSWTEDDIAAVLAELNPDASEEEIADAVAALEGVVEYDNEFDALQEERDAALAAAGGGHLEVDSPAWNAFHDLLRLDEPLPEPVRHAEGDDGEDLVPLN